MMEEPTSVPIPRTEDAAEAEAAEAAAEAAEAAAEAAEAAAEAAEALATVEEQGHQMTIQQQQQANAEAQAEQQIAEAAVEAAEALATVEEQVEGQQHEAHNFPGAIPEESTNPEAFAPEVLQPQQQQEQQPPLKQEQQQEQLITSTQEPPKVASMEPQADAHCAICGKGNDGRTMVRFLPVAAPAESSPTNGAQGSTNSPTIVSWTQDITLHVFCGKTASILPLVNQPDLEILSKAGIKNKHGIGPEVNSALARTRHAIVSSPKAKEKIFFIVKEFESHLSTIRNIHLVNANASVSANANATAVAMAKAARASQHPAQSHAAAVQLAQYSTAPTDPYSAVSQYHQAQTSAGQKMIPHRASAGHMLKAGAAVRRKQEEQQSWHAYEQQQEQRQQNHHYYMDHHSQQSHQIHQQMQQHQLQHHQQQQEAAHDYAATGGVALQTNNDEDGDDEENAELVQL